MRVWRHCPDMYDSKTNDYRVPKIREYLGGVMASSLTEDDEIEKQHCAIVGDPCPCLAGGLSCIQAALKSRGVYIDWGKCD